MSHNYTLTTEVKDREVVMTRAFEAPREIVFHAWTDAEQVAQWWGPHNYTNPICEIDLRVGGAYRIVMRSQDGNEFPVKGIYLEIDAPERLVITDLADDMPTDWLNLVNKYRNAEEGEPALKMVMTITFEKLDPTSTKLTITSHFDNNDDRDAILKMGAAQGWAESFERLDNVVAMAIPA